MAGEDIEACRERIGNAGVASSGRPCSGIGNGNRLAKGALDGSLVGGVWTCKIVCKGVRPHVSNAPNDGLRTDAPDSIELKLDVLLCGPIFGVPPLVERCLGISNEAGGSMEMALGRVSGRIICDAPFRYDK